MRHFITGGSGFVGMHLIETLLAAGHDVTVYDKVELDAVYKQNPRVRFVQGDIRETEKIEAAMRGHDVLQHNAAILPLGKPGAELSDVNVRGTQLVLEAALKTGVKKVVNVSSTSVYGIQTGKVIEDDAPLNPIDPYGQSKADAEVVCKKFRETHDLDVSIVRPCPIIGTGRMGIFGILFDWIARGKRVYVLGDGNNPFQFLSVDDLCRLCMMLGEKPAKNEDFNAGSAGYGTSGGDLTALIAHAGTKARVQPINAFFARNVLCVLDVLHLSPLMRYHYMTADKPHCISVAKAEKMLGWKPKERNIDALIRTYDWYMAHREELATMEGSAHRTPLKQGILTILRLFS